MYLWEENEWKTAFKKLTEKGLTTKKTFWKFLKPFLTNKGFIGNNDIELIHKNKIISYEKQLTKLFNSCYINVVEKSRGTKSKTFGTIFENSLLEILSILTKIVQELLEIKQVVNWSNVCDS